MSDEPVMPAPTENIPSVVGGVSAVASATAPFIYFDRVPNFGINNGIANMTLEAFRYTLVGDQVVADRVIVAHLRMGMGALKGLRGALDGIEKLLSTKPEGQSLN